LRAASIEAMVSKSALMWVVMTSIMGKYYILR
jgi:hypothetical protein